MAIPPLPGHGTPSLRLTLSSPRSFFARNGAPFFYFFTGYKINGYRRLDPVAALYLPKLCASAKAITFPAGFTPYQTAVIYATTLGTAEFRGCFDHVPAIRVIVA
jgi:hypothetical protein